MAGTLPPIDIRFIIYNPVTKTQGHAPCVLNINNNVGVGTQTYKTRNNQEKYIYITKCIIYYLEHTALIESLVLEKVT